MDAVLTKQLAEMLNGREYMREISSVEEAMAKANGLVVVHGASDDLMEFCGAIYDEVGCYDGGSALVDAAGILGEWESASEDEETAAQYLNRKPHAKTIEALWCAEPGYSWTYKTDIPHETFEIVEDGEPYCRGIVFSIKDLTNQKED